MEDACGCLMAVSSVGGAGGATSAAVGHQSHPAQRQGERAAEQRMRRPALTAPLPLLLLLLLLGCWRPLHASARVTAKARKPRPQVRNAAPQPWASLDPPPGSPAYTSMVRPRDYYRVYRNLYYQNGRWYAFVEPGSGGAPEIEEGLTSNNAVFKLPIADLKNFTNGLNVSPDACARMHTGEVDGVRGGAPRVSTCAWTCGGASRVSTCAWMRARP
eukprot:362028-Chlamydomonas_euryale.AAC.2